MNRLLWLLPTGLLLLFDRLTKLWAASALALGESQPLIGQTIRLTRVHNIGGAFGVFPGTGTVFIVISAIVSVVVAVLLLSPRFSNRFLKLGLCVILAGAIGNLIDRVTLGYVLDFFEFRGFPVFNVADACITVGAALIILCVLFGGERHRPERETDHA